MESKTCLSNNPVTYASPSESANKIAELCHDDSVAARLCSQKMLRSLNFITYQHGIKH